MTVDFWRCVLVAWGVQCGGPLKKEEPAGCQPQSTAVPQPRELLRPSPETLVFVLSQEVHISLLGWERRAGSQPGRLLGGGSVHGCEGR